MLPIGGSGEDEVPFALVGKKTTWSYFLSPKWKSDSDSLFGVSYVIWKPRPEEAQTCQFSCALGGKGRLSALSRSPRNLE